MRPSEGLITTSYKETSGAFVSFGNPSVMLTVTNVCSRARVVKVIIYKWTCQRLQGRRSPALVPSPLGFSPVKFPHRLFWRQTSLRMLIQICIYSYISILNQPVSCTCALSHTRAREQHTLTVNINMSAEEKVPECGKHFSLLPISCSLQRGGKGLLKWKIHASQH